MTQDRGRIVYATGKGRICAVCGWPEAQCACSSKLDGGGNESLPDRITAKLRIETKGRGGKTVTVIDGLPRNDAFLKELAARLKRQCGTGGSAGDGAIELQGDHRAKLRAVLSAERFVVKG